jgi:hypothetical protein
MSRVFVVVALILEDDAEARAFFRNPNTHDLETLTGERLNLFAPPTEDLFTEDGRERYVGLERKDLPCLWVEDQDEDHFTVPLRGLTRAELRDLISDLADAAERAPSAPAWEADFSLRRAARHPKPQPSNPPTQNTAGYNVRVTVLSPSLTPVDYARVHSTLGGETKKVDGGWEIAIPGPNANGRKLTVFADVSFKGWLGRIDVLLADDHLPSVIVELKKGGEQAVRGIVLDARGGAVHNAIVSVAGYEGAVATDENGAFELPTHSTEGEIVQLHVEKAPYAPLNETYKVSSGSVTLLLKDATESKKDGKPEPVVAKGGDNQGAANGKGNDNKDNEAGGHGLLVKLGRIAGLGGIALGTFFLLFEILIGENNFKALTPGEVAMVIVVIYAISALALIIHASQVNTGRTVPVVAAGFAAFMGWVAMTVLHSPATETTSGYKVRVTVVSPNQTHVTDAQVTSNLGGERKQVEGGWEFAITGFEKQHLKIHAEVSDQGWVGDAELPLAGDHSPTVAVQLKKGGELSVRGIVLDSRGNAVPNARVTVSGYGEEAVSTNADGTFKLATHANAGDTIKLHAEKAPFIAANEPYTVGSGTETIVLKDAGSAKPPQPKIDLTGDAVIDRVRANLASLKRQPRPATESQLAETLAPLFSRPVFRYGIREEDWRYFLYPLCRTRLILEEYENQFKSKPEIGEKITQAVTKMVNLQNEVAKLYGPTFSVTAHIDRYIKNKNAFIDNLPKVVVTPDAQYFEDRDKEIRAIRELLKSAGLPLN